MNQKIEKNSNIDYFHFRDTLLWVKAVDLMRSLKPKLLVPQHTRPIEGQDEIYEILTAYRDAIQLVHDQTVRYMNKGLYPDEITRKVVLPPYLAEHPFLQGKFSKHYEPKSIKYLY